MARGRKTIPIDREKVTAIAENLLQTEDFVTQQDFLKRLWNRYNSERSLEFPALNHHQVLYMRCKEWGIDMPKGRRGRRKLSDEEKQKLGENTGVRMPRGEKMKVYSDNFSKMRRNLPNFTSRVEQAENGSMSAAVALKCIDCSAGQRNEIRDCTCYDCPLYPFRPFKTEEEKTAVRKLRQEFIG